MWEHLATTRYSANAPSAASQPPHKGCRHQGDALEQQRERRAGRRNLSAHTEAAAQGCTDGGEGGGEITRTRRLQCMPAREAAHVRAAGGGRAPLKICTLPRKKAAVEYNNWVMSCVWEALRRSTVSLCPQLPQLRVERLPEAESLLCVLLVLSTKTMTINESCAGECMHPNGLCERAIVDRCEHSPLIC